MNKRTTGIRCYDCNTYTEDEVPVSDEVIRFDTWPVCLKCRGAMTSRYVLWVPPPPKSDEETV